MAARKLTRFKASAAVDRFAQLASFIADDAWAHAHGRAQKARLARVLALVDKIHEMAEVMLDAIPPSGPRRRIGSKLAGFVCTACYPHPWHKGPCPLCATTCGPRDSRSRRRSNVEVT